jgi:thioredoxin reductase (NADPH)
MLFSFLSRKEINLEKVYDLIIIGSGPSGLTSGLYGARAKMDVLIIEKERTGGQIATTEEVANYPGSIPNATGPSLIARMVEQCDEFGAKRITDNILEVEFEGKTKVLKGKKDTYYAKAVIIATGARARKLDVPGELEFTGRGVAYCAMCDGDFFRGLEIFAIGGGDTALEESIYLTRFAKKVTIVHRSESFKAAKSIIQKAKANDKIEFLMNTKVSSIEGEGLVERIKFENTITGEITDFKANDEDGTFGVFVFVGYIPQTEIFKGILEMDKSGYILTDENMRTNIPGVFAAGDIRPKVLRQVVTATADGAIAAVMAEKYIEELE